ncbi:hypothetical protein HPT27_16260 [Permianibacter sp. IMCC34836]|uniref:hypothetical protein n=1 Tax=Permianibacter fluminis TaxID=2738515 RepID=UPI001552A65D|nr:hypothetical protein [Permianibacter fluminis]NQD38578.1 hypothetical protein [Permianibacter fluminis]
MKKLVASLLAAIGMSSMPQAAEKIENVDINKIRYTMPTVAADQIEYGVPTKESFQGAPQFHEDEWAQLEFFPGSRLPEIQKLLKEYKLFEKANRTKNGWLKIYSRQITREQITPITISPMVISNETSSQLLPAPILVTASKPLGQVKDGFSLLLGTNAYLYGQVNSKGISVLGAYLAGADDMMLSRAFATLNKKHGLILVDWRQQFILISVAENGEFNVWQP